MVTHLDDLALLRVIQAAHDVEIVVPDNPLTDLALVVNYTDEHAAILAAEQARLVDPYDYSIANFIEQHKTELENRMRTVYTNSVIEERFGNVELSKNLWREIITKDVPNGAYYLKARRKLQQYGFQ